MEAAGPSMAAMQSNQTPISTKKSPEKYNKFKQNNVPPLNSPPTNNVSHSTSANKPPNNVVTFPMITGDRNGPAPFQKSAADAQKPAQVETVAAKTLNPFKTTVNNEVKPPPRSTHNNVIPFQRHLQNNIIPFQRNVQNNVILFQRNVQNNVILFQRNVQNNVIPFQRNVQNHMTPQIPHQFRFPLAPFQYDVPAPKWAVKKYIQSFKPSAPGASHKQRPNLRQKNLHEPEEGDKKVIVTGFPVFTKPEELVRQLSVLGTPQIELCKNRVAVVLFESEREAAAAVEASETIPIYGTLLTILKYTRKNVFDLIKENRRVTKHSHKGPPVKAPTEIDLTGPFDQQVQNIEDAIRLTQEEVDKVNPLFEDIEKYMRMIYPNSEAVPFGSITTGQGIKSSDADCFLALKPGSAGRPGLGAGWQSSIFVSKAARILRLYPDVFKNIICIPKANTPIIKFLHAPTNINCDLNSKTSLGVQNSRLIGHLLKADRSGRFGSVALLLKYWARVHQLSGTGRLTNYALLLMLLAYLQRNWLPSVLSLQSPAHSLIVDGWEAGFDRTPLPPVEAPPMMDILGGFFLHYAGFNFEDLVICPFLGEPLKKADFEKYGVLPPELALYQRNVKECLVYPLRTDRSICVQDPFELSHNVASGVSSRLASEIKAFIMLGAGAYTAGEKSPGELIRTILLTRPPPELPVDTRIAMRVSLPPRLLQELGAEWRPLVRQAVIKDVFKDMLFIDLTRRDAVSREAAVEIEVYVGNVTRPIWKRGANTNARCTDAAEMLDRHRDITKRILADKLVADVRVPFEVELGFRKEPRGLTITTTAMEGAEMDPFRAFRQFAHNFIHRWFREFLKPYLKNDPIREDTARQNGSRQMPARRPPRRPQYENRPAERQNTRPRDTPIETVAFVNSNHKDLNESLGAISLSDSSKKDSDNTDAA